MNLSVKVVLGAIAISVLAGLIVNYISKQLCSPGSATAGNAAFTRATVRNHALPNLNQSPQNAAAAYGTGAPVTNFRPYLRAGQVEVPAS